MVMVINQLVRHSRISFFHFNVLLSRSFGFFSMSAQPFNRPIIYLKFSTTWSCPSLTRFKTLSDRELSYDLTYAWCVKRVHRNHWKKERATPHARDAYSLRARVVTALGAVNMHHASLTWRHFMDSPPPPPLSMHMIWGQPPQTLSL